MGDCPSCGHPRVWSLDHEIIWCSVYGHHLDAATVPARWETVTSIYSDTYRRNVLAPFAGLIDDVDTTLRLVS